MLPKRNRLTSREDFQKVLKQGKMQHGKLFAFSYLVEGKNSKRFGIIVSNKISKNATDRNFIKRAARFAAGKKLSALPDGILGVFLGKKEAVGEPFKFLVQDAESILTKIL